MKKLFYWIGVYDFCVFIHLALNGRTHCLEQAKDLARNLKELKDICDGKEEKKPETGFRPKKVVNKIGF